MSLIAFDTCDCCGGSGARRMAGPIVQLRRWDKYGGQSRIHYFYREPGGQTMLDEDAMRFGFQRGDLLALVERYAPTPGAPQ